MPETITNVEVAAKMTQKECYARIMEVMADDPEIVEFCEHKIAQLSKPKSRKVNPEAAAFRESVAVHLAEVDEPMTNKALAEVMDVSSQKMSAALRALVKEGIIVRIEEGKTVLFAHA